MEKKEEDKERRAVVKRELDTMFTANRSLLAKIWKGLAEEGWSWHGCCSHSELGKEDEKKKK